MGCAPLLKFLTFNLDRVIYLFGTINSIISVRFLTQLSKLVITVRSPPESTLFLRGINSTETNKFGGKTKYGIQFVQDIINIETDVWLL